MKTPGRLATVALCGLAYKLSVGLIKERFLFLGRLSEFEFYIKCAGVFFIILSVLVLIEIIFEDYRVYCRNCGGDVYIDGDGNCVCNECNSIYKP